MSNEEQHINQIIENTFKVLKEVYENQKEPLENAKKLVSHTQINGSRILFPRYNKFRSSNPNGLRLSEQELRFIFVEQFNKYLDEYNNKPDIKRLHWFYSVETPTRNTYKDFSGTAKPKIGGEDDRSAMLDLVIHDEYFKRIALIEFKAHNPKETCFTKDFLKLREEPKNDGCPLTYFIMYVESYQRSSRKDTIKSLNKKIFIPGDTKGTYKDSANFYCFVLKPDTGQQTRIENLIENPNS